MQLNIRPVSFALSNVVEAGEEYFINCLYSHVFDLLSLSPLAPLQKNFSLARVSRVGDQLVGGVVFACTRVHCLLLSTKRIGVSAFQNSRERAQVGFLVLDVVLDDHCSLSLYTSASAFQKAWN